MKDFLKYVGATIVGSLAVSVFGGILFLMLLGAMAAAGNKGVELKPNSVLHLQLKGELTDRAEEENPLGMLFGDEAPQQQGLNDWIEAIRMAAQNENIDGIYIEGGAFSADYAALEEVRKELENFKKSKKFVIAYADNYTQGAYYLASVADKVLINPSGMLDWHGVASQPIFFTKLLEKLGVKVQVFKVGTYKSAVEPFILDKMSDANREQVSSFIGDIWQGMVKAVAKSRKLTEVQLNEYANQYVTLTDAKTLKKMKLVDNLAYVDEVREELRKHAQQDDIRLIAPRDFVTVAPTLATHKEQIAVYYAAGNIVDAASPSSLVSSQTEIVGQKVVEDLDLLANNDKVKAVVLRINSGGGSAFASEQMWRAVQLLRKKKPVVVSMGGMAASGGYYMACGAHRIFADASTITGSIGIFGMIPDFSELLTQKLGLTFDVVKTNDAADFGAMGRSFNPKESEALQAFVDRGYQLFITRVAEGRTAAGKRMTPKDVDKVGQGRVWTGRQALQHGLVDELGGLNEAVKYAARLGKLKEYDTKTYPAQQNWLEQLQKNNTQDKYLERKLKNTLGEYYEPLTMVRNFRQNDYVQARIFFVPNLK